MNKATDSGKEQTMKYILNELETVEIVLSGDQSQSNEYKFMLNKLKQAMNDSSTFKSIVEKNVGA